MQILPCCPCTSSPMFLISNMMPPMVYLLILLQNRHQTPLPEMPNHHLQLGHYTPFQRSWGGGMLLSLCLSVCPSVCRPNHVHSPLCIFHIHDIHASQIHFIFTHLINQLRVSSFFFQFQNLSFCWIVFIHVLTTSCSGPVFCLLLGVSSDYAQPITGQVTEVTCPVIGRAQPELTPSKRQKMGPGLLWIGDIWGFLPVCYGNSPHGEGVLLITLVTVLHQICA